MILTLMHECLFRDKIITLYLEKQILIMKKTFLLLCAAALFPSALFATDPGKPAVQPLSTVIEGALRTAGQQYLSMAEKYIPQEGRLPRSFAGGRDLSSDSRWWCSGFFPGTLWYLYENSGDGKVLDAARLFTGRVEREKHTTNNHDVGFMLFCSFGNGLRLTGEELYEEVLLTGARSLATRFDPAVGLIRSWDHNRQRWQYPVIIDNMMNLELMMWAADYAAAKGYQDAETFRCIALSHADSTMLNHFRPDYGTCHVVSYDPATGGVELRETHQGYADHSTWSRGEAWALYGYTMMYRVTGEERYLRQAQNIAGFIIDHPRMPADYIPYWDFDAPGIPVADPVADPVVASADAATPVPPRDASAAAIMASALIELADHSSPASPELAAEYMRVAETQVRTLASPEYTAPVGENGNFILMHSTGAFPLGSEIDVPLTYADYYFVEALTRLNRVETRSASPRTAF
uniref:Glycoside hydrolase family 88 protein n=1 Tax=termite gut metagenome TaxID=433724 RepID=S0DE30_9ZZZZ